MNSEHGNGRFYTPDITSQVISSVLGNASYLRHTSRIRLCNLITVRFSVFTSHLKEFTEPLGRNHRIAARWHLEIKLHTPEQGKSAFISECLH